MLFLDLISHSCVYMLGDVPPFGSSAFPGLGLPWRLQVSALGLGRSMSLFGFSLLPGKPPTNIFILWSQKLKMHIPMDQHLHSDSQQLPAQLLQSHFFCLDVSSSTGSNVSPSLSPFSSFNSSNLQYVSQQLTTKVFFQDLSPQNQHTH